MIAFALFFGTVAGAEEWLIPVGGKAAQNGALGSRWIAATHVLNKEPETVSIRGPFECSFTVCSEELEFYGSSVMYMPVRHHSAVPGTIVIAPDAADLDIRANVRDFNKGDSSAGVTVHAVPVSAFIRGGGMVFPVRVTEEFRGSLRIFQRPADSDTFRVRFYSSGSTGLIREEFVHTSSGEAPYIPSFAEIRDFPLPEAPGAVLVIQVIPIQENTRWWGYASVTANDTHHITLSTAVPGAAVPQLP